MHTTKGIKFRAKKMMKKTSLIADATALIILCNSLQTIRSSPTLVTETDQNHREAASFQTPHSKIFRSSQKDTSDSPLGRSITSSSLFDNLQCPEFCSDASTCNWKLCSRCEFKCAGSCTFYEDRVYHSKLASATISHPPRKCKSYCSSSKKVWQCNMIACQGCGFCSHLFPKSTCPMVSFMDVTAYKIPKEDAYWNSWGHSGRPYTNEGSPLFVDLNGDGKLDFFNSMHAHGITEQNYTERFELGESVPLDFQRDGVVVNMKSSTANDLLDSISMERFRKVSYRLTIDDKEVSGMDPHGQNVLDLDGDGYLDIMVNSGGNRGQPMGKMSLTRDNFLFWGDEGIDEVTGKPVTIFRGGRDAARAANVHMRGGRGRVNYMFDANGDGLLDIFVFQDRPASNLVVPGVLLINQGDRTWKEDTSMREYTRSMILTDADGDGLAQEIILSRGFCYPQQSSSEVDPKDFSRELIEYCSTRPVGTTAVFKYNSITNQMDEISKLYWNTSPYESKQPPCCQQGSPSTSNNCHVKSIGTGDFDGDLLPDYIFLYKSKMVFYFSSDRPVGALPVGDEYVGAEIYFPQHCISGASVRVLDLDNDGKEDILVMCEDEVATVLLYTRTGKEKDSWTLDNQCNTQGALGDLVDASLAGFTEEDILQSCNTPMTETWLALGKVCAARRSGDEEELTDKLLSAGMSVVDLNNDGFMDIVVAYDFGYTRYFYNVPSETTRLNRFIIFNLEGAGNIHGNKYAIGATVILKCKRGDEEVDLVRYISSYQHTTDKYGYKDDRIVFGLGQNMVPISVRVRWPKGTEQMIGLRNWKEAYRYHPIKIKQEW